MTRSRLKKNKFNRYRTKENWNAYKIQRNKYVQLRKKAIKSYFEQNTKCGDVGNKLFWKTIRLFLSNKGSHDNDDITLEENGDLNKDKEISLTSLMISTLTLLRKPLIKNHLF